MPHPAFEWSQEQTKLEVKIPLSAFGGSVDPKKIEVTIKENDIVCVKHDDKPVYQQRLHDNMSVEDFRVEDGNTLVIDLEKENDEAWPCLLRQPMKANDALFLRGDSLDTLLRQEMTRLPRDEALEAAAAPASGRNEKDAAAAAAAGDDDFDDMLEDALEEVNAAGAAAAAAAPAAAPAPANDDDEANAANQPEDETLGASPEQIKTAIEYELKMTEEEFDMLRSIIQDATEKGDDENLPAEERQQQRERAASAAKMLEIGQRIRRLRSKRPTMKTLLEILHLEIWKARMNHGDMEETETEAFRDDEEREMTPDALLKKGVESLDSNVADAMHYIRLAAIHHDHSVSACLLHRLYSQARAIAKGAYFVFRRALMDDCDPSTNLLLAEFVDKGMPLFPPYMALGIYFYQRGASVGSTHAMLTLANTYKQGAVSASPADEESRKRNQDEDKFLGWLQAAEDRGSPRAYLVRASLHAMGENGQTKSGKLAKQYIDRIKRTEPSLLAKAPGLESRISHMYHEETGVTSGSNSAAGSPTTGTTSSSRPNASAAAGGASAASPAGTVAARPSAASRLQQLEQRGPATSHMDAPPRRGGMMSKGGRGAAAGSNKWRAVVEKTAIACTGLYAAYCAAFPLRIVIAPYAFEMIAYAMHIVGLGAYIRGSPSHHGDF